PARRTSTSLGTRDRRLSRGRRVRKQRFPYTAALPHRARKLEARPISQPGGFEGLVAGRSDSSSSSRASAGSRSAHTPASLIGLASLPRYDLRNTGDDEAVVP